jgi:hypothetical protein
MKAISLWQPWASAMAIRSKMNETRHWPTNHRGLTAIHAAKRLIKDELIWLKSHWHWCAALSPLGVRMGDKKPLWDVLPFGAIVAVGNLIDCVPVEQIKLGDIEKLHRPDGEKGDILAWTERQMGNYEPGRYAWIFSSINDLKEPIPFVGRQGFFHVPDELLEGKY